MIFKCIARSTETNQLITFSLVKKNAVNASFSLQEYLRIGFCLKSYFIVFCGIMLEKVLVVREKTYYAESDSLRWASCCSFMLPCPTSSEVEDIFPVGTHTQSTHLHHVYLYRQESLGQGIIWAAPFPHDFLSGAPCGYAEELLSHNLILVFYFFIFV